MRLGSRAMKVFNAEAMRRTRMSKHISQVEFGEMIGMSSATVCRIERGEKIPSPQEIQAITQALDVYVERDKLVPDRNFTVASRLTGLRHRLKVQVSLEQFRHEDEHRSGSAGPAGSRANVQGTASARPLVFYVPLDGLEIEPSDDQEEEESQNQLRPKQR